MRHRVTRLLSRVAHLLTASTGFLYEYLRLKTGKTESDVVRQLRQLRLPSSRLTTMLPGVGTKRILMFSYLPYWLEVCLPTAAVLGQLGHTVDMAYLPGADYRSDSPWYKKLYDRLAYGQIRELSVPGVSLNMGIHSAGRLTDAEENEAVEQAKLDAAYILQTDKCDMSLPEHRKAMAFRLKQNRSAISILGALMDKCNYDLLIVPNGAILEFGVAYRAAKLRDLPVVSFEFMGGRGRVMISNSSPVVDLELEPAWNRYRQSDSPDATLAEVVRMVEARGQAKPGQAAGCYQVEGPQDGEQLRSSLNLASDKKTALMCTNVVWDSAALGRDSCFEGSRDWIEQTVRWFAGRNDWQLVVRVHPAESLIGTAEPVAEIVRGALPDETSNVIVVGTTDRVNTYSLAAVADVAIVHTSTVGIEFAVLGLPVVVVGRAHYRGKGFTVDPETSHAYFDWLDTADLTAMKSRAGAARNLAAAYFDFYINFWPAPFPWHMSTVQQDIKEWPVQRMMSAEGLSKYGETLALLANEDVVPDTSSGHVVADGQ